MSREGRFGGSRLGVLIRRVPVGTIVLDVRSGQAVHLDARARESIERYSGDEGAEIFHPDGTPYGAGDWPLIRSVERGERVEDEEYYFVSDGARVWVRCDSAPIRDDGGGISAGIFVGRDVTRQKSLEERLTYYAGLREHPRDAFVTTDERFTVTAWNLGAEELYGWTEREAIGRDVRELMGLDPDEERWGTAWRGISGTHPVRAEVVARTKNGTPISVETTSVSLRDEDDELRGYFGIHRNLSGQERAGGLSLRERAIAASSNAILIADTSREDDPLIYVNEAFERVTGYSSAETLGRNCRFLQGSDRDQPALEEVRTALREGRECRVVLRNYRKDGSLFYNELYLSPVRDQSGGVTHFVGVQNDVTDRRRLEKDQKRLADIVQNSSDFVGVANLDWRMVFVNRAGREMAGLEGPADVTTIEDYFMPEDVGFVRERIMPEVMREGRWTGESRLRHLVTGEPVPVTWDVFRIDEPGTGRPLNVAAITRDITERKRAEEQLRFQARLLDHVQAAVIATDLEGTVTTWNEYAESLYGWSREEAVGRRITDLVVPTQRVDDADEIMASLQEGGTWEGEFELRRKDGSTLVAHVSNSFFYTQGEQTGIVGISTDITERKRAELELETRTRQQAVVAELGLRALSNADLDSLMDEAVALVSRTLDAEYAEVCEQLPGGRDLAARAGVGWDPKKTISPPRGLDWNSLVGHTLKTGAPVIFEDLNIETRFEPSPLLLEHGVVSGISVAIPGTEEPFGTLGVYAGKPRTFSGDDANFLQAVANVLATAVEREGAENRLDEVRESERRRMARDLHDEALQDLGYALAEARRVNRRSEGRPTEEMQRLISALDRVGQQLRSAVYDLRLEGETRSFSELLELRVELQRAMAVDCEIQVEVEDGILPGPIGQTGIALLRVLGEAMNNARRHACASNVRISIWTSEGRLIAEVTDDGRGFDTAQVRPATSTGGVGLKGMRERARALGSELEVRSQPGKGTTVRFELPLDDVPGTLETPVRILLVEDHAAVREAIAAALEQEEDLEVAGQASSLAEARTALAAQPIDVAVLDLGLPDGYGGDLIRDLRAANPEAQALVLSATLDRADIARAVESGAAGVLHKVVRLDEVVRAVRRLRAGETLMPLAEVVELLRYASSRRDEQYEAQRAISSLTPREREVLQALAEGLNNAQIAKRLHISLRTQRNHMASILSKLDVHTQLQALVFALRHGVVEVPRSLGGPDRSRGEP